MKYLQIALGAALAIGMSAVAQAEPPAPPKAFVTDAIKGDNSEIMLGKMAQDRGASPDVREFGRTLVTDHTQAKEQMVAVANALAITPPDEPTQEAKQAQQMLSGLSGPAFDREFAQHMVEDHKKDIAKFKAEAGARNGPVSQLAEKQLPVLEKHLEMAESLQKTGQPPRQ